MIEYVLLTIVASGISSLSETISITDPAKARNSGKAEAICIENKQARTAKIGSTTPPKQPIKNDFLVETPLALSGKETLAPSGIF